MTTTIKTICLGLLIGSLGYGIYLFLFKKTKHPRMEQLVLVDWRMADGMKQDYADRIIQDSTMRNPDGEPYKTYLDTSYFVPQLDTIYNELLLKQGIKRPRIDSATGLPGVVNYYYIEKEFILHDYNRVFSRNPHYRFIKKQ